MNNVKLFIIRPVYNVKKYIKNSHLFVNIDKSRDAFKIGFNH